LYVLYILFFFFCFALSSTPHIYSLSLHDALPICDRAGCRDRCRPRPSRHDRSARRSRSDRRARGERRWPLSVPSLSAAGVVPVGDRKSTRLNSSHVSISYAVFCLKKKKNSTTRHI